MDEFYLKDIKFENEELIINWEKISNEKWELYYKKEQPAHYVEKTGFKFMSVEWAGNNVNEPTWSENTLVHILYWGISYFDGVRHMYLGSEQTDNYGYENYPNINTHIEILKAIKDLEIKYCRDLYYY